MLVLVLRLLLLPLMTDALSVLLFLLLVVATQLLLQG